MQLFAYRNISVATVLVLASLFGSSCILGVQPREVDGARNVDSADTGSANDTTVVDLGDTTAPVDGYDASDTADVSDDADGAGRRDSTNGDARDSAVPDADSCRADGDTCLCNYNETSEGVCAEGRLLDDAADAGETCSAPPSYEPEETLCDAKDNDCDGEVDEGCSCDYLGRSAGVCLNVQRDHVDGECPRPTAFEMEELSCDGTDNDCDGSIDEGCPCDFTGKDKGVCRNGTLNHNGSCQRPADYEPNEETSCDSRDNDCDGSVDENCSCNPGDEEECYSGPVGTDGVGICKKGKRRCNGGTWGKCSDVVPDAKDSCDGTDDDCDGTTDEGCPCNYDGSSTGVCANGTISLGGACTKPADWESREYSCDMKDNDCDGQVDEGCPCDYRGMSDGVCGMATLQTLGSCQRPSDFVTTESSNCDSLDNDCDGVTDEGCPCDYMGDPDGVCARGTRKDDGSCGEPQNYASDEMDMCDQLNNDCDDTVDEGCNCTAGQKVNCYTGPSGTQGVGECAEGSRTCRQDGTWTSCSDSVPVPEICDANDNDCDGAVDEGLTQSCALQKGVCSGAEKMCASGSYPSCDATNYGRDYEAGDERSCDSLDNDCDGSTDEGLTRKCAKQKGVCKDAEVSCRSGTFPACTSAEYGADYESPNETSCDNKDNDCDDKTDEGVTRACPKQKGVCQGSTAACNAGSFETCDASNYGSSYESTEKTCGDGKDNDCDGSPDCADPDCDGRTCGGSGTACSSNSSDCTETECMDGKDNDGDGLVDACDSDCKNSCPQGASCSAGVRGVCSETNCQDGVDNDGDGGQDCMDKDCHQEVCRSRALLPDLCCDMSDNSCDSNNCP